MLDNYYEKFTRPSLYELNWSREKKLPQISIPDVITEMFLEPILPGAVERAGGLFSTRDLGLSDFKGLSKDSPWGFGGLLLPAEPLLPAYTTWDVSFSEKSPFDFCATMYIVFKILNPFLSDAEEDALKDVTGLPPKQVEVYGVGFERGGSYLSVNVYKPAEGWLQANLGRNIPAIAEAMKITYNKSAYREFELNEFRAEVLDDGRPWQSCPGSACSLGVRDKSSFANKPWIEMREHNMDSPDQQHSHFAGIAAMADEIRKFNTK